MSGVQMQHRTATAALATATAAAVITVVTGCGGPNHTRPAASTAAPTASSQAIPPITAPVASGPSPVPPRSTLPRDRFLPRFTDVLLRTEAPPGPGPQTALRFPRALQARQYLHAAQQLSAGERITIALGSESRLQRVMTDVVGNAELAKAGLCTDAEPVNEEAAVVTCGWLRVVVHVRTGFMPGVQINSYFPHDDVFLGPHTHAFTNYDV